MSYLLKIGSISQSLQLGSWCSWPNTPPCHGGDRRFESGRARQFKIMVVGMSSKFRPMSARYEQNVVRSAWIIILAVTNYFLFYYGAEIWIHIVITVALIGALVAYRKRLHKLLIEQWLKAEQRFEVDPAIFIGLYLFSFLPFFIGIFLIGLATKNGSGILAVAGLLINRLAWALPYAYVWMFGKLNRKLKLLITFWLLASLLWIIYKYFNSL